MIRNVQSIFPLYYYFDYINLLWLHSAQSTDFQVGNFNKPKLKKNSNPSPKFFKLYRYSSNPNQFFVIQ